jgi:hypothetical protein
MIIKSLYKTYKLTKMNNDLPQLLLKAYRFYLNRLHSDDIKKEKIGWSSLLYIYG